PRRDAVDAERSPHPALDDELYRRGEALFGEGRYPEALEAFTRARAARPKPHPFYAYYLACCRARLGMKAEAVADLRLAIEDGWRDLDHLDADDDLSALRGFAPFEAIRSHGWRLSTFDTIEAGASIELDVPSPTAIVAVGAIVDGAAWEGWA